jgi:ribonuclease PH
MPKSNRFVVNTHVHAAETASRHDARPGDELRPLSFKNHIAPSAAGSTLITCGNTHVICAVSVEEGIPRWMKEQKVSGGWLTAEYAMLPYSTLQRKQRDSTRGKIEGRSQEIQRLIGRAMRAAVDMAKLGPRTFWVDCDVLQADGGTRTASITGGFVALSLAVKQLMASGALIENPIRKSVAAVSVGIVNGLPLLDLDYVEDSSADVDMNLVMTDAGEFIEMQGTAEKSAFGQDQLTAMLDFGRIGIQKLLSAQASAIAAG